MDTRTSQDAGTTGLDDTYDVVVVGGGVAGLSAALTLARARRSVLVVDGGEPRNAPAAHLHNYLGREGTPPAELLALGRDEAAAYGARIVTGRVAAARTPDRPGGSFELTVDGAVVHARRVLLATGATDVLPEVPGLAERWGRTVLHCPFCHGREVGDGRVVVLGTGATSVHQALLFRGWTPHVTLLLNGAVAPGDEQREQLAARDVEVVDGTAVRVEDGDGGTGVVVRLADGRSLPAAAVVVGSRVHANAGLARDLGLETEDVTMGEDVVATRVPAGPRGATAVPGVWVAGNVTDPMGQLITGAAGGMLAAAEITGDLAMDDTRIAVEARRAGGDAPRAAALAR